MNSVLPASVYAIILAIIGLISTILVAAGKLIVDLRSDNKDLRIANTALQDRSMERMEKTIPVLEQNAEASKEVAATMARVLTVMAVAEDRRTR